MSSITDFFNKRFTIHLFRTAATGIDKSKSTKMYLYNNSYLSSNFYCTCCIFSIEYTNLLEVFKTLKAINQLKIAFIIKIQI